METKDILWILAGLTAAGYIVITLFIPIPLFIKAENIVYATLYVLFTYIAIKKSKVPLLALIFFNTGRISRSIITSYGEIARMAKEHLPLLVFLLIYGFYVAYVIYKEKS